MEYYSADTKRRKEELIGKVSKQRLTRTSSTLSPCARICRLNPNSVTIVKNEGRGHSNRRPGSVSASPLGPGAPNGQVAAFFLIKNLDTGKEFVVKEYGEDGMWNRLSDLQTGKQLTMEEFEKSVGYSPVVKELMRRQNVNSMGNGVDRKMSNSYLTKSFRYSKRRGQSLLKNIKSAANSVAGGFIAEKEREQHDSPSASASPPAPPSPSPSPSPATPAPAPAPPPAPSAEQKPGKTPAAAAAAPQSEWVKVRQQGKTHKELSAVRLCQEIQAHKGSIWTMKFSSDGKYLASAGEDKVIHIWETQECEIASLIPPELASSAAQSTPAQPPASPSPDRPPIPDQDKKKKGKSASRRGSSSIPDYVQLPETAFGLSEEPICSFEGHLDDVLDVSWSKSQPLLLSSSMDKTVRLWDVGTKACLKLFAHNDYVTCIQFNPVDSNHFISGSLDHKVRIWNIPGRRVVDWTDLHEMVTAACYTPDGQGAAIGLNRGSCRMYNIEDGKLNQTSQFDADTKKKANPKKITGFEFVPDSPSEVLITSADSRIRIFDGSDLIHKFRGHQNNNSQIAASFSPDRKHVISASEDSRIFFWRREEPPKNAAAKAKPLVNTRAYECFQCKDVSVAIPWPGNGKVEAPTAQLNPKRKDDPHSNSKKLPPLPKKNEKSPTSTEEDPASISNTDPGIGNESFSSNTGGSMRLADSPSISSGAAASASWSPGWSWFDGGSHGSDTMDASAWGLVIVAAGLGGEIRAYQNFGLPLRVGRQTNLFKDLT